MCYKNVLTFSPCGGVLPSLLTWRLLGGVFGPESGLLWHTVVSTKGEKNTVLITNSCRANVIHIDYSHTLTSFKNDFTVKYGISVQKSTSAAREDVIKHVLLSFFTFYKLMHSG